MEIERYRRRVAICPNCHRIVKTLPLTYQQWEIAKLIIGGIATAEIAGQLFISIKTVEAHRQKVFQALGVHNPAELIRWANDQGVLALLGWDATRNTI